MKQSESVNKLNSRLAELRAQVAAVKSCQRSSSYGPPSKLHDHGQMVDSFDAFPFISPEVLALEERETAFWRDMMQHNGDAGTDDNGLPEFEDLLRLD